MWGGNNAGKDPYPHSSCVRDACSMACIFQVCRMLVMGGHGGARGATPPRAQNRGPPPWEKNGPPKRFGDFWAEARPKLCSSYFLSTFYLILSKLVKNLRLAPHFIIYPYVFININICSQKIPLLSPPPSPPLG